MADVHLYVDTVNGAAGNDGTDEVDQGGGVGPWDSIATAYTHANFESSAGNDVYLHLAGGVDNVGATQIHFDGAGHNGQALAADNYFILGYSSAASFNTGEYHLITEHTASGAGIRLMRLASTRFEIHNLQHRHITPDGATAASTALNLTNQNAGDGPFRILNYRCQLQNDDVTNTNQCYGIDFTDGDATDTDNLVMNSIVEGTTATAQSVGRGFRETNNAANMEIYNCLAANLQYGFYQCENVQNCVTYNCNDGYNGSTNIVTSFSDDANSYTGVTNSVDLTADFTDPANGDFTLKTDSTNLKDAGTDLSASTGFSFAEDIDETARTGTWSAGPSLPAADTTPPVLSSPDHLNETDAGVDARVTTDEGNGTSYVVATQFATTPSVAQIKAGQDHLGSAADASGNNAVSAAGAQTITLSGLAASTDYYLHFVQTDDAANDSNTISSTQFSTLAPMPSITNVDGDDVIDDLQTDIIINGTNLDLVTEVRLTNGTYSRVQVLDSVAPTTAQFDAHSGAVFAGAGVPCSDSFHSIEVVVDDGTNTDSHPVTLTGGLGWTAYPLDPGISNNDDINSILYDLTADVQAGDQVVIPDTGPMGNIIPHTVGGFATGFFTINGDGVGSFDIYYFTNSSGTWSTREITVAAADIIPDAFSFTDLTDVALSSVQTSNAITVAGIDASTPISVTGAGEYRISTDGGTTWSGWTTATSTVDVNSQVQLRVTASALLGTTVDTTLNIGGVTDVWSVTTLTDDTAPFVYPPVDTTLTFPYGTGGLPQSDASLLALLATAWASDTQALSPAPDVNTNITYYVDKNHGSASDTNDGLSEGAPFATINHAVSVAVPGDFIYIKGDPDESSPNALYDQSGSHGLDIQTVGTASNRITIRNWPGDKVVLDGGSAGHGIFLDNADYWTIYGLIFRNFNKATEGTGGAKIGTTIDSCEFDTMVETGMRLRDVTDYTLRDVFVHNTGEAGISIRNGTNVTLERVESSDNDDGLGVNGDADGFHTFGGENLLFIDCVARNNSEDGFDLNANCTLVNAVAINSGAVGMKGWRRAEDFYAPKTFTVINALMTKSGEAGMKMSEGAELHLYNSVVADNGEEGIAFRAPTQGQANVPAELVNNIISGNGTAGTWFGVDVQSGYDVTESNSLYHNNSGGDANGFTIDGTSVTGADPLFVNPAINDFHLQAASPARSIGKFLNNSYAAKDADGEFRTVTWDAGRDEYTSDPPPLTVIHDIALLGDPIPAGGPYTVTSSADDASGNTGQATWELTVQEASANPPTVPGNYASQNTAHETPLVMADGPLIAHGTAGEGGALSIQSVGNAVLGSVDYSGGNVTYTPDTNASGAGSFDVTLVEAGTNLTVAYTVPVTIAASGSIPDSDPALVNVDNVKLVITKTVVLGSDNSFSLNLGYTDSNGVAQAYNFSAATRFMLTSRGDTIADTNVDASLITVGVTTDELVFKLGGLSVNPGIIPTELVVFDAGHANGQSLLLEYGVNRLQLNFVNG